MKAFYCTVGSFKEEEGEVEIESIIAKVNSIQESEFNCENKDLQYGWLHDLMSNCIFTKENVIKVLISINPYTEIIEVGEESTTGIFVLKDSTKEDLRNKINKIENQIKLVDSGVQVQVRRNDVMDILLK